MQEYFDRHGKEIKAGMTLKHENGDLEQVYEADSGDLGFNATNNANKNVNVKWSIELYPLYQFNLLEWEIVEG